MLLILILSDIILRSTRTDTSSSSVLIIIITKVNQVFNAARISRTISVVYILTNLKSLLIRSVRQIV